MLIEQMNTHGEKGVGVKTRSLRSITCVVHLHHILFLLFIPPRLIPQKQMKAFAAKHAQPQTAPKDEKDGSSADTVAGAAGTEIEIVARRPGEPKVFLPVLVELSSLASPVYAPVRML